MLAIGIILYLMVTLLISYFAMKKVKNSNDFIKAGANLGFPLSTAAFFATWFGAETILAAPTAFYDLGWIGLFEEPIGAAFCLIFTGLFLSKKLYNLGFISLGDLYKSKYGIKVEKLASLIMAVTFLGWEAAQLSALALLIQMIFNISFINSLILSTFIVMVYSLMGGMWSISFTDFIQAIIIIIALISIFIFVYLSVNQPVISDIKWPESTKTRLNPIKLLNAILIIGLGSIPSQDLYQRLISAKDAKVAKYSSMFGGLFYLLIGFLPIAILVVFVSNNPDFQVNGENVIPSLIANLNHPYLEILFYGALMSAILSSASSGLLAPSTLIAENLFPSRKGNISLKKIRTVMIFWAILSFGVANLGENIFTLVGLASSISLVALFCPLIMALFYKKHSPLAAILSLGTGLISWLFLTYFSPDSPIELLALAFSFLFYFIGFYISKLPFMFRVFKRLD